MNSSVLENMSPTSANAGLRAGSVAGLAMALFAATTILVLKSRVLEQLAVAKDRLSVFMPNVDLDTFYLLGLFAVPAAMILVYIVVGLVFGMVFERVTKRPLLRALTFVGLFLFGAFLGLTTNLPVSKLLTVAASLSSCLVFSILFLNLLRKHKLEGITAKHEKGRVAVFLVLVFVLPLCLWWVSSLVGVKLIVLSPFYMFIPFTATILTCLFYKVPLGSLALVTKPNRWFLVAWLSPALLSFATIGVSLLFPGVNFSPSMEGASRYSGVTPSSVPEQYSILGLPPIIAVLLMALLAGPTVNAFFAFGEELGWRGFLQHELAHLGFWKSSLLTGLIWGIWHTPLILQGLNYPEHPLAGVGMMIAFTTLLSPLFAYIRTRTKSVIGAAIMHGSLNAMAGISVAFVKGSSDLLVGLTGLCGLVVLSFVNVLLYGILRFAPRVAGSN